MAGQPNHLPEHSGGKHVSHTEAKLFPLTDLTGGAAILFLPGWHVEEEIVLVKGRAIAALVKDRTCSFYVLSVYIHPDDRKRHIEKLLQAWRYITKKSDPCIENFR